MKKLILIVVFVAVFAVLLNDGGKVFVARSELRSSTGTLGSWAMNNAGGMTSDQVGKELVTHATDLGIRVTQYGQDRDGIQIWTETDVQGLWVLGTYKAVLAGVPLRSALGRSIVIKDHVATQYR